MKAITKTVLGLALALGSAATAAGPVEAQTPGSRDARANASVRTASIQVENHSWLDMHVYAVRDGTRRSLGVVTGLSHDTLKVPASALTPAGDVQILADPIGGSGAYLSPRVVVAPGDVVRLILENHLALSTTSVASRATHASNRSGS